MKNLTFTDAYKLGLTKNESQLRMKEWEYQVSKFSEMLKAPVLSGKWKMAHLMLSKLGVQDDNCAYCGTDTLPSAEAIADEKEEINNELNKEYDS